MKFVKILFRGGPARIGDLFEFIHGTYIDTTQLKSGLPLNIVLISDGQTQNDDKEQLEKWTRILKKVNLKLLMKIWLHSKFHIQAIKLLFG